MNDDNNSDIRPFESSDYQRVIHIASQESIYTISESELTELAHGGSNFWKDVCFASWGVAIPSVVNAIVEVELTAEPISINIDVLLNSLVGACGVTLGILSALLWFKTHKKTADLIAGIKGKPKYKLK
jgi:hypothetical protein